MKKDRFEFYAKLFIILLLVMIAGLTLAMLTAWDHPTIAKISGLTGIGAFLAVAGVITFAEP